MDITIKIALLALVVQVFFTFYVFVRMGNARTAALAAGELHFRDIALGNEAWSDDVKKLGNNLQNQFETPVIFYIAVVLMAALSINSWILALGAVAYVGLRVLHFKIHTGKNHMPTRFKVFGASLAALAIMWLRMAVEVILL